MKAKPLNVYTESFLNGKSKRTHIEDKAATFKNMVAFVDILESQRKHLKYVDLCINKIVDNKDDIETLIRILTKVKEYL